MTSSGSFFAVNPTNCAMMSVNFLTCASFAIIILLLKTADLSARVNEMFYAASFTLWEEWECEWKDDHAHDGGDQAQW